MTPYRDRFITPAQVASYDEAEYAQDSYSSFIWELQREALRAVLQQRIKLDPAARVLDFACGTGRILALLEELRLTSDGIDISPAMLERARERCPRSSLLCGDIVGQPALAAGPYDVITAFRFLLNAEPAVRRAVLGALRARLKPNGVLITNVHGNATSLRHVPLAYRRWQRRRSRQSADETMLEEMTGRAARELFRSTGFEVVEQIGFGILPQVAHKSFLRPFARAVDRQLSASALASRVGIDLLFVCRPCTIRGAGARHVSDMSPNESQATTMAG